MYTRPSCERMATRSSLRRSPSSEMSSATEVLELQLETMVPARRAAKMNLMVFMICVIKFYAAKILFKMQITKHFQGQCTSRATMCTNRFGVHRFVHHPSISYILRGGAG